MRGLLINDDAANALLSCFAHIYPTLPFKSDKYRVTALLKSRDWEISTFSPLPVAPQMLLDHQKRTGIRLYSDFQASSILRMTFYNSHQCVT